MKLDSVKYKALNNQLVTRHVLTIKRTKYTLTSRELWTLCMLAIVELGKAANWEGSQSVNAFVTTCEPCSGTGRVGDDEPCPRCDGSGVVPADLTGKPM